jgi:hypothetical protein
VAKPLPRAAVTVIDLRNVVVDKKPPKREAEPTYSLRMKVGARMNATALNAVQLSEALKGAGISVPPPNVYARLTPGQISAAGKAYMFLMFPSEVYPDRVEFDSSSLGNERFSTNGPMVVLREAGTYVVDFLVEFPGVPAGLSFECRVMGGLGVLQLQEISAQSGPQHILVVVSQDAFRQGQDDLQKSIGLHCSRSALKDATIGWTLYLVDITKL